MDITILDTILSSTLRMAVPLILASTGGAFSMRSGVSDLGSEGMMIAGAFFGVFGSFITGNAVMGLIVGMLAGAIFSLLHAVMHITYKVNATISGMSVNLLGLAITPLLLTMIWGMNGKSVQVESFSTINAEWLSKIPFIGEILLAQNVLFYSTIVIVIIGWVFMFKTQKGLRMRMVGENPQAAATVGINVVAYKYFGVIVSGLLCGMAGAYLSLGQLNLFVENMTAGRGYIAVVINAFGQYSPLGALLGSIFFAFFDSLQSIFQNVLPSQLVMMMPYILTLIVITFGTKRSKAPAGIGKFHDS